MRARGRIAGLMSRLGRRDLTVLAIGLAISTAGDAAALVALLLRLRPAGSGWVAALLAGELVPVVVLAPIAGLVVDRFETRRVLVIALGGQAVLAVPLAFVAAPLTTVALFTGLCAFSVFVRPATAALVPAIAGEEESARGYSRLATGTSLGFIIGPATGGLVAGTLGVTAALLLDACSFVVLTGAAALLRTRRHPGILERRPGWHDLGGGFGLLWRSPVLRVALSVSAIAVGCAVVDNVAAPFRFVDQLGASSTGYGLYLTVWGVGAFVGVQLLARLAPRRTEGALAAGNLLTGLGIAGIGIAPNLTFAFSASAVGGLGNGLANVAQSELIARHTPADARGRAFAAAGAVLQTAIGVGTAAGAPLVALLAADGAMVLAGTLATAASMAGLVVAIRHQRAARAFDEGVSSTDRVATVRHR